jgi:hypothetical protein
MAEIPELIGLKALLMRAEALAELGGDPTLLVKTIQEAGRTLDTIDEIIQSGQDMRW